MTKAEDTLEHIQIIFTNHICHHNDYSSGSEIEITFFFLLKFNTYREFAALFMEIKQEIITSSLIVL